MSDQFQRRTLLQAACAAGLASALPKTWAARIPGDPWLNAQAIIDRLSVPPSFPPRRPASG